jgi:hypothetical protein
MEWFEVDQHPAEFHCDSCLLDEEEGYGPNFDWWCCCRSKAEDDTKESIIKFGGGKIMTPDEAVAAIDAINNFPDGRQATWQDGDPEDFHGEADEILLATVPVEVADAYRRLQGRCAWWACA